MRARIEKAPRAYRPWQLVLMRGQHGRRRQILVIAQTQTACVDYLDRLRFTVGGR